MKIALVTIHNVNNYGAQLQTLACQAVLSRFGSVTIIDYRNPDLENNLQLLRRNKGLHGILSFGKDVLRILPRRRLLRRFRAFMADYLVLSEPLSSEALRGDSIDHYDVVVAGSDQIWNPACISNNSTLDPAYFLDFCADNTRRISYASSAGGYRYSDIEAEEVRRLLSPFHSLSARESGTARYLSNLMGRPVDHVVDPTLLLSREEWDSLVKPDSIKLPSATEAPFILLYSVPQLPLTKRVVRKIAERMQLPVVSIDQGLSITAGTTHVRDAGPIEFLELFRRASFVVTDSFHGTCFSLIFGKPFVVVSKKIYSNRISSLLSEVGAIDRLILNEAELKGTRDYSSAPPVYDELSRMRHASVKFLARALAADT